MLIDERPSHSDFRLASVYIRIGDHALGNETQLDQYKPILALDGWTITFTGKMAEIFPRTARLVVRKTPPAEGMRPARDYLCTRRL